MLFVSDIRHIHRGALLLLLWISFVSTLNRVFSFNIQPAWFGSKPKIPYSDLVTKNFEFCNFSPKYTYTIAKHFLALTFGHSDHTVAAHFRKSFCKHLNEICYWYWPILLHPNWIWPFLCRIWQTHIVRAVKRTQHISIYKLTSNSLAMSSESSNSHTKSVIEN